MEDVLNFLERLKLLLDRRKMTMAELERSLGFGNGTIRRWSNNYPSIDKVIAVADLLNVDIAWLLTGKEEATVPKEALDLFIKYKTLTAKDKAKVMSFIQIANIKPSTSVKEYNTSEEDNYEEIIREKSPYRIKEKKIYNYKYYKPVYEPNKIENIPYIGTVAAGIPNLSYYEGDYEYIGSPVACDFAMRANGLSMYPVINDNDYIYVKSIPFLENGEIGIISINGETTCKRFYIEKKQIILKSLNPDYSDMKYDIKEGDDIRIMGRVILTPEQEKRL